MIRPRIYLPCLLALIACLPIAEAAERRFAGAVSSATPEATAAGVEILEAGGNAIDAAIAVSLALGVTEPAGSGLAGQTVMLVKPHDGDPFVVQGTTWSPRSIPANATTEQLAYGHTATSVPSTPAVLWLAHQRFGAGTVAWSRLSQPAIRLAEQGFVIGPFRARAFSHYHEVLARQPAAAAVFVRPDGLPWQAGQVFLQPALGATLRRLAELGGNDFYRGGIARQIAADMQANGGWITAEDLAGFPEPQVVAPLRGEYRGYEVLSLPPPFGGWVVLQALNVLAELPVTSLAQDNDPRRLALLDALAIAHESRRAVPVADYLDYRDDMARRTSRQEAQELLQQWLRERGGETTHFSVVDGQGTAVAVTQSIDSYFGAGVLNPDLGILYNNYMQGFQLDDPAAPYYLEASQMPKSSMSATMLLRDGQPQLVLGSPGSARIISAVTQVASYWVDVKPDVAAAVAAFRVHVVPPDRAYVEGESLGPELLQGIARRGFSLQRPAFGVADGQLDPYFGGVHALAREADSWTGAADPRRDGRVGYAWIREP